MRDVIVSISLLSLGLAIMFLALGVEKLHQYAVVEMIRLAEEVRGLRHQLREMDKVCSSADLCFVTAPDLDAGSTRDKSFDVWMRDRNERAHREYMERTSRLPPCAPLVYPPDQIAKFYGISHGGID
jgi:hypothetical protein